MTKPNNAGEDLATDEDGRTVPVCNGCGNEIDPDCCHCGMYRENHTYPMAVGHCFVPMGCDCYRENAGDRLPPLPTPSPPKPRPFSELSDGEFASQFRKFVIKASRKFIKDS